MALVALGGCATTRAPEPAAQDDDAIVVAGRPVHTGTRVVTWMDAGGFNAYRTALLDASGAAASFGARKTPDGLPIATGDVEALVGVVDQIVLHYDGIGNSRECFEHLAERQLSSHFLIDVDGTVYQTLDIQERAYHATVANNRSIGIEIANIGAFPPEDIAELNRSHRPDIHENHSHAKGSAPLAEGSEVQVPRPTLSELVQGTVHGIELVQQEFTPAQYDALAKLIAALCETFPRIARDFPRDGNGDVVMSKLPDDRLAEFRGILGHFHIQENKVDPGPAFQWERILQR